MKRSDFVEIMRMAWRFARITGFAFAECLRKAWANYKLRKAMQTRVCEFYYIKTDGSKRQAFGTLQRSIIEGQTSGSGHKSNEMVFTYFDTEKGEFRCFKRYNLLTASVEC